MIVLVSSFGERIVLPAAVAAVLGAPFLNAQGWSLK